MPNREATFRTAIEAHGPALKRLCRGYEADGNRREELEQEILLALWRALPSFRGEASQRTFVLRVAHNTAIRHVSKAVREPSGSTAEEADRPVAPSQADHLDRRRQRAALFAAIRQLPSADRELMLLHLEGLANTEIGTVMGLTPTNISTRLSRARERLGRQLGVR